MAVSSLSATSAYLQIAVNSLGDHHSSTLDLNWRSLFCAQGTTQGAKCARDAMCNEQPAEGCYP